MTVARGQRVQLTIVNRCRMAHPVHLHGHHFRLAALRDTLLVPVNGSNLFHMATGMMTEIAYDTTA